MDMLSLLKLASLRRGGKIAIALMLLGMIGLSILLVAYAVKLGGFWGSGPGIDSALTASVTLLAALSPLLLLTIAYASAESSHDALVRRTDQVLENLLPARLALTPSPVVSLRSSASETLTDEFLAPRALVQFSHLPGSTMALYVLSGTHQQTNWQFCISIELIVHRANVVFYIPAAGLQALLNGATANLSNVCGGWPHTLAGACGGSNTSSNEKEGYYSFTREIGQAGKVQGIDQYALVGSVNLAADFLWNPAAQLYFAEDLMYFARAFIAERRPLFSV